MSSQSAGELPECRRSLSCHMSNFMGTFSSKTEPSLYFNASRDTDVPVCAGGRAGRRCGPIAARTCMCRQRQWACGQWLPCPPAPNPRPHQPAACACTELRTCALSGAAYTSGLGEAPPARLAGVIGELQPAAAGPSGCAPGRLRGGAH